MSSCSFFENFFGSHLPKKKLMRLDRLFFNLFDFTDRGKVKAFKGAREALEDLSKNVILLATTVSKTYRIEERLNKLELLKLFTLVLGADIIPKSEHIPCFARYCGINLKKFTSQAFYVGDSTYDMILARGYDIYSIGITNTIDGETLKKAGAKEVIENWQDLLKILK